MNIEWPSTALGITECLNFEYANFRKNRTFNIQLLQPRLYLIQNSIIHAFNFFRKTLNEYLALLVKKPFNIQLLKLR